MLRFEDVTAAAERIAGRVMRTPASHCEAISRVTGADVVLKLDNLQVTGAFKERGAANRLALLSDSERERGVVAMSAGNHAQAVARHARLANVGATIVMPKFTPVTKVTRTAAWGAEVVLHGETLEEAALHATELAGRHAEMTPEAQAERPEALKPTLEADLGNAPVSMGEKITCPFQPYARYVTVRRLTKGFSEGHMKMERRKTGGPGRIL